MHAQPGSSRSSCNCIRLRHDVFPGRDPLCRHHISMSPDFTWRCRGDPHSDRPPQTAPSSTRNELLSKTRKKGALQDASSSQCGILGLARMRPMNPLLLRLKCQQRRTRPCLTSGHLIWSAVSTVVPPRQRQGSRRRSLRRQQGIVCRRMSTLSEDRSEF